MNNKKDTIEKNDKAGSMDEPQREQDKIQIRKSFWVKLKEVISIIWGTSCKLIKPTMQIIKSDTKEGSTVNNDIRQAFAGINIKKIMVGSILIVSLLYLLSGVYVVNPGEKAVVKLFGKPINIGVEEGIHYRFPWPFQSVDMVNISKIRREGIGQILPEHQSIHSSPEILQFLTGDNNIIEIKAVVQYRIKNAAAYLYNVNFPAYQLINETIRSAITEIGGSIGVDDILTIGKERLQELLRSQVQSRLDQYNSGLELVEVNFNKVYPPEEVAGAFRDVSNANQDKEKRVNDAWGYRNTVIPQARGDADKIIKEAEAYKIAAVNKANGEAGRFNKILNEYEKERTQYVSGITIDRLYIESMEKILNQANKYILDTGKAKRINIRLLQKDKK